MNKIIQGDCLEEMKKLPENSVDSIVTDPPYELGFMGKSWDSTGIANNVEMWREALRVLKPGGHLLSFSGTRTYHRMACAIEDAGFEVRDMIEWVYGSGFPKSLNIGKAVDKLHGNERKEVEHIFPDGSKPRKTQHIDFYTEKDGNIGKAKYTKGTSEWEGWGTALKPAHEPICMARKPLAEKTVAENCLKWGTGGINIDESRVEYQGDTDWNNTFRPSTNIDKNCWIKDKNAVARVDIINRNGRFPANLIHDNSEEVRECFPDSKAGSYKGEGSKSGGIWSESTGKPAGMEYGDSGNASRFFKSIPQDKTEELQEYLCERGFPSLAGILDKPKSIIYQAKASKSERNKGCEELPIKSAGGLQGRADGSLGGEPVTAHNNHPTVKPVALMEYLIKMVTPKGGTVLDPFAGSGSTLVAAKQNGYNYIGIEMTPEYIPIIEARLK